MNYAELRPNIKSGDVIAYTHIGVYSWYSFKIWLVRLFTQSEYTHVGVVWKLGKRVFLLEAVGSGTRIYPLSKSIPFFHITGKGLTESQIVKALEHIGEPYSYIQCAAALYDKNDITDNKWECAEYVKYILDLRCKATPSDVVQSMLDNGSSILWIKE